MSGSTVRETRENSGLFKVKKLHELATFEKAHDEDVGYDLTCCTWEVKDNVMRLKLGIAVEPPRGTWFMMVPRSSFAKHGWTQANNVGIIDPNYRGEWIMNISPLYQLKDSTVTTELIGLKVAQAIPMLYQYSWNQKPKFVEELNETARGEGGFGSTDRG